MEQQHLYEQIEDYLEGKLSGKELNAFEQKLKEDTELAQEVKLHQKIEAELGDATKMELRGILADMKGSEESKKIVPLRPRRNIYRMLSIAASLIILAAAFWYFAFREQAPAPAITDDTPKQETPVNPPETSPELVPEEVPNQEETTNPGTLVEENTPGKNTNPEQTPENTTPIIDEPDSRENIQNLASFETNPEFENLMVGFNQNPLLFLEMELPEAGESITLQDGSARFRIRGQAFAQEFIEEGALSIKVYNNNHPDNNIRSATPVYSTNLNLRENKSGNFAFVEEGTTVYDFQFIENLNVQPGLYYYVIRNEVTGNVLAVNKFKVNQ